MEPQVNATKDEIVEGNKNDKIDIIEPSSEVGEKQVEPPKEFEQKLEEAEIENKTEEQTKEKSHDNIEKLEKLEKVDDVEKVDISDVDTANENSVDTANENSVDTANENSVDTANENSVDTTNENSVDTANENSVDTANENSVDSKIEKLAETEIAESIEEPSELKDEKLSIEETSVGTLEESGDETKSPFTDKSESENGLGEEEDDDEDLGELGVEDEEDVTDEEVGSRDSSASRSSQVVPSEREEGDGEEEKKDKKLDHDEDRRNPQYIPKKGMFYEHDDRTAETEEEPEKKPREPKKGKVWEEVEVWGHDMYNEEEQSPKTTEELIDSYGYDIRKEEGPPKARRRRKYGKGPNKYQRSWEDEGAYAKTPTRGSFRGRRQPRNFVKLEEDFPELPSKDSPSTKPVKRVQISKEVTLIKDDVKNDEKDDDSSVQERKVFSTERTERPYMPRGRGRGVMRGMRGRYKNGPMSGMGNHNNTNSQTPSKGKAEDDIAALAQHFSEAVINIDKNVIKRSNSNSNSAEAIEKPPQKHSPKHEPKTKSQPKQVLSQQFGPSIQPSPQQHAPSSQPPLQQPQQQQQQQQQHQHQQESRSKRYSAQRQRPLPQSSGHPQQSPVVPQQGPFIPPQVISPQQQPPPQQPPPPPPQQMPGFYPQQQHGACVDGPAAGIQNFPGMQVVAFLPPHAPQPQPAFPPPPLYVPQPPYLPSPTIAVQPGPAEVYQGSGITYYSTQSQMSRPKQLSRRVNLAIPIVAPNESQAES